MSHLQIYEHGKIVLRSKFSFPERKKPAGYYQYLTGHSPTYTRRSESHEFCGSMSIFNRQTNRRVSYKKLYDLVYALAVRYAMREGWFSGYDRLNFNHFKKETFQTCIRKQPLRQSWIVFYACTMYSELPAHPDRASISGPV